MAGRTIFAIAAAAALGMAVPASAGQLAGMAGAVVRPLTNTLGALQSASGGANASAVLGDPGLAGFGGSGQAADDSQSGDLTVHTGIEGNVGYSVMVQKKLLSW